MCQAILRGIRNIARNRGRGSLLILFLSMIIGVTVTLQGVNAVVTGRLQAFESGIGTLLEVRPVGSFGGAGQRDRVLPFAVAQQMRTMPGVARVDPYLLRRHITQTPEPSMAFIIGVEPGSALRPVGETEAVRVHTGRGLQPNDATETMAIVGQVYAEGAKMSPLELSPRPVMRLRGVPFQVVGRFATGNRLTDNQVFIPLQTFRRLYQPKGLSKIFVQTTSLAQTEAVRERLTALLGQQADTLWNDQEVYMARNSLGTLWTVSWAGLLGALGIGGALMILTMVLAFRDRKGEIGMLKALGASSPEVMVQYASESLCLAVCSGLGGIIVALGLHQFLATSLLNIELQVASGFSPLDFTLRALGLSVLLGAIGALYPVWSAVRLHPVEALRHE